MNLITEYKSKKVADYLRQNKPKKVALVFCHGLGDVIMFMESFNKLKALFPETQIDLAFPKGLGFEVLADGVLLLTNPSCAVDGYDYTFAINFPMSEHTKGLWTKAEWCCLEELGIDPVSDYPVFPQNIQSNLVACHFQATALPGTCNPTEEVTEQIWNEVIEAGLIPIESFFVHKYSNPVNVQFACVDRGVRGIPVGVDKLIRLLSSCTASICVASGNLPLSIAMMPTRTLYLKKEYSIQCYTKKAIASIDINNYKTGTVKAWLGALG